MPTRTDPPLAQGPDVASDGSWAAPLLRVGGLVLRYSLVLFQSVAGRDGVNAIRETTCWITSRSV